MKLNLALSAIALLSQALLPEGHLFSSCTDGSSGGKVDNLLIVRADKASLTTSEKLAISTYSGYLARTSPQLALVTKPEDLAWLNTISETTTDSNNLDDVLSKIPCDKCTYVLCEIGSNSTSAGISFASASKDPVIVATSDEVVTVLEAHGITMNMNLTDTFDDAFWALDQSDLDFSNHLSIIQNVNNPVPLSDLSVKCGALNWWGEGDCEKDPQLPSLPARALNLLTPGDSVVLGWGGGDDPEWDCVHASTSYGSFGMIATDQAINAGVLNIDAESVGLTPQKRKPAAPQDPDESPKHTISFVMSDGDNVQWILNDWSAETGNNGWWSSEDRGKVKMGWTLSPSLGSLAPTVLKAILDGATENDQIIAGPSGAAYAFVNDFPDDATFDAFSAETSYLMDMAGMKIVNVLNDEGWAESTKNLLEQDNIDGVFLYEYNGYSELEGAISFVNNKPVVGGRFNLWSPNFYNVTTLVTALAELPNLTDITSSDGYTVIPVHAWSHNVTDIVEAAQLLEEDGRFDIVLPEELLRRVAENVIQ
ncbi:hypothetical protein TrST_g5712 [Triparma strigata]|uniref:GxGYxYP putative glycoside hydrolase C-terminal domain-containing protein n=1 Tax=Triparma strigata TaxID=1606541 RepID=A0A9W7B108_9STRA|nr:hypothetical protein TrST_g5712 [Triparma strigata]